MILTTLDKAAADPILGMAAIFAADTSQRKVDLGIGIYKNDDGDAPVLETVKEAERRVLAQQKSKAYLSSAGNPAFNTALQLLVFGPEHSANKAGRIVTVQSPGGTGGLRVALDLIKRANPESKIWLPSPTWPNHHGLIKATGQTFAEYAYYDRTTNSLVFDDMLRDLQTAAENDVVVLHGCCHNPSGADLTPVQWNAVVDLIRDKKLFPLVDLAYLGFGNGLEKDAYGTRLLANHVPEMLVVTSCSKNFAIYRDRVAGISVIGKNAEDAEKSQTHLLQVIRSIYSMPPDHGAAVVATILTDAELRRQWQSELDEMRNRVRAVRVRLSERLGQNFSYIAEQNGMFSFLTVTADQIQTLRNDYHIYISASGRVNVAGITSHDVDYIANAIGAVLK